MGLSKNSCSAAEGVPNLRTAMRFRTGREDAVVEVDSTSAFDEGDDAARDFLGRPRGILKASLVPRQTVNY